jgi:hypothetical protein
LCAIVGPLAGHEGFDDAAQGVRTKYKSPLKRGRKSGNVVADVS